MTTTAPPQPVSRRARPAKKPLDRAMIVAAAIGLLRHERVERVTMRRLAAALDTGPASLYVYFRSASELHASLLDQLLSDVDLQSLEAGSTWQDRLVAILSSYAGVLLAYPSVARLSVFTRHRGPNGLRVLEAILALLDEGGVAPGTAAWGADQLVQYAAVTAAEQGIRDERAETADDGSDLARALASVDPNAHPRLYALGDALAAGREGERFRWGIDVLLAGLEDGRNRDLPASYIPAAGRGRSGG